MFSLFFFFSSRRRHTRCLSDWSSDVCSSDLPARRSVRLVPMVDGHNVRQPQCFDRFHCTSADCEDTCCIGWEVLVDRETYEKYQGLPSHRIGDVALSTLVDSNPARSSVRNYARFRLQGSRCPALHQGLCSIQQTLGEPFIPDLCSTYPRVLNAIGGALERSFHLSCPEAARLLLSVFHSADFGRAFHPGPVQHLSAGPERDRWSTGKVLPSVLSGSGTTDSQRSGRDGP